MAADNLIAMAVVTHSYTLRAYYTKLCKASHLTLEAHGWISHPPRTAGVILAPPIQIKALTARRVRLMMRMMMI